MDDTTPFSQAITVEYHDLVLLVLNTHLQPNALAMYVTREMAHPSVISLSKILVQGIIIILYSAKKNYSLSIISLKMKYSKLITAELATCLHYSDQTITFSAYLSSEVYMFFMSFKITTSETRMNFWPTKVSYHN